MMTTRRRDLLAVLILVAVWLAFFWRLFVPVPQLRVALAQGDFSDQFVAFGGYQYARFAAGEVPLWNPYNNGGMPFIADTQAAVFYPPRLVTIALANLSGGWTYHALEVEMTAHVLFYTLTMYLLVRRMTRGKAGTHVGALVAALVGGYGGYLTGYPPLQLALLEAGVWLPLAVLGLYEATNRQQSQETRGVVSQFAIFSLVLTGFALGLSWMAGHPQTSFFLTYMLIAFFAYRVWAARLPAWTWLAGTALFGVVAVGVVAVTLFPGVEYLIQTSRAGFNYDDLSHGFPLRELWQIIVPGVVSQWSPLWVGLTGLALALFAVYRERRSAIFWAGLAVFALVFSLGGNGPLYPALFQVVPGLRFFRGQERAAYLYANSMAILAGLGAAYLASRRLSRRWWGGMLALVVLELGAVNLITTTNYTRADPESLINRNPLIDAVRVDANEPFRVDAARVLRGNWGSYYQIADIQGISPLFLRSPQQIIEHGLPDERAWELFAVRYVYSDWDALTVPGEVLAEGEDISGPVKLHRLTAERPFAHLLYDYVIADSDDDARAMLADAAFNPRTTAILHTQPDIDLPMTPTERYGTTVTAYTPEYVAIVIDTPDNAVLSLAQVDYPGWYASLDGQAVPLLRAYGGLSAVAVTAGQHTLELVYNPLTYRVGAVVSLVTWISVLAAGGMYLWRRRS